MLKVVLASSNAGKVDEINQILEQLPVQIIPQTEFSVPEIEETGTTFIENAIIKARHAAHYTEHPVLADDSGLVVDALNPKPGVYSARYAGPQASNQDRIQKVLNHLNALSKPSSRRAAFHCSMVWMTDENDPVPTIFQGSWQGEILSTPRGTHGFGYDPIFFVPTHQCSAAELDPKEKNRISHRGQALKKLITWLRASKI